MNQTLKEKSFSKLEMMQIAAARRLTSEDICLVGIGEPSVACNLARLTHAKGIKLIYESGTVDTKPEILPLSIGDGILCERSLTTVSLPEIFQYWLQAGRISVGFLGGAQIDRFSNLNTSIIGEYKNPRVRLPGAGGAPEIATGCERVFIIMKMSPEKFVERLDFRTTFGYGDGGNHRASIGIKTKGPEAVITDLCVMEPDVDTKELVVVTLHQGVELDDVRESCGWDLKFSCNLCETPPPTEYELKVLRDLKERTEKANQERDYK